MLAYKLCLDLDVDLKVVPYNCEESNETVEYYLNRIPVEFKSPSVELADLSSLTNSRFKAEWECTYAYCGDSFVPEGFDFEFLSKLEGV
jgi:hypothetical protein